MLEKKTMKLRIKSPPIQTTLEMLRHLPVIRQGDQGPVLKMVFQRRHLKVLQLVLTWAS